jgi:VCBS repeat-containing protein
MTSPRNTSSLLVLRAALLVLLTGCGIGTNTNAPKPVAPGSTSTGVPVAPDGLQLGYIWHPDSRSLYPILGVSGAAHYGSRTLPADPTVVAAAGVSSASSWGLVLHENGTLEEWSLPATNDGTLAGRVATDSSILFSPSGTSAALVSASTSIAVVIGGLPSKPQVATVALPAGFVKGEFAVSDSGNVLAGTKLQGAPGIQVGIVSETRAYSPVVTIQAWGGAGFVPGPQGDAAVIADGATARLTYASNLNGASPAIAQLSGTGLLEKPVAVSVSQDGKWAYAVDSARPQIARVSIGASAAPTFIACACRPEQLVSLTADGVYLLSGNVPGQPAWILDTRTSQPRTFFVPAIPGSAAGANSASTMKPSAGTGQ